MQRLSTTEHHTPALRSRCRGRALGHLVWPVIGWHRDTSKELQTSCRARQALGRESNEDSADSGVVHGSPWPVCFASVLPFWSVRIQSAVELETVDILTVRPLSHKLGSEAPEQGISWLLAKEHSGLTSMLCCAYCRGKSQPARVSCRHSQACHVLVQAGPEIYPSPLHWTCTSDKCCTPAAPDNPFGKLVSCSLF